MNNFFKKIFAYFKNNSFFKIYLWVCTPILVLILSEIIIYFFNYITYTNMITDNYQYKLETLSRENNSSVCSITDSLFILSTNSDFMDFVTGEDRIVPDSPQSRRVAEQINLIKESSDFIDEICIVKRDNPGTTICYNVERSINDYFGKYYVYSDYADSFWIQYSPPLSGIEYIAPTEVLSNNEKKFVYPIVFSKIGEKNLNNNYIIVNIDLKKITNAISDEALTPNTDVLMLHDASGKYYDLQKNTFIQISESLFERLTKQTKNKIYYTDKIKKLAVSYSPKNMPFGYSYVMTVPKSSLLSIQLSVFFIAIILLLIALFVVFYSSKKLFKPWEALESMFSLPKHSANTVDFVQSAVEKTIENNMEISEKLSRTMPFIQERYLVELLHSSDISTFDNCPINFMYNYFAVIIIKLRRTSKFTRVYSDDSYVQIRNGIFTILKGLFSEKYDTFPILNDNDTFYIVLNVNNDDCDEDIMKKLHYFEDLFQYDHDCITLHIGFGGINSELEGLRKSYHDAQEAISAIPGINMLKSNAAETEHSSKTYSLSMDNENKIYNYLLVGNVEDTEKLINDILNSGDNKNIDKHILVQLYVQIIHIIMKAMKARKIPFSEENKSEVEMLYEIMACKPLEIYETIFRLLKRIREQAEMTETHVTPEKILEYINLHYAEELSLTYLSDKFNISSSYLSKIIKKHCDVGFAGYIAALRTDHAKKLLKTTNKTIADIYTESGFNNRRTFMRTFKAYVGISPTDYRKASKNPPSSKTNEE